MSEEEMREFTIDVNEIDWETLIRLFAHGLRKFILKEEPDSVPR
jgi:hypothetical protein